MKLKNNVFPVMFQKLQDYVHDDERFTKVRLWLMHTGLNYNGSIFDENVIVEAMPTLEYIPILGFIEKNKSGSDDFSNHRYIIKRKDGEIVREYIGQAYGTILSNADNNAHLEDRLCDDGITRKYVVVDGLMWNRFEKSAEILQRDGIKGHSMELHEPSCEGYEDEDEIFHFTKFAYDGACILGMDYSPAMEGSTIEVQFTMKDFVKDFQNELTNKLTTFSRLDNVDFEEEGGKDIMSKENKDFSLTVMEQFSEISNIVSKKDTIRDYWGDTVPRYYALDIQDDTVICVDRGDNYNYFGFKFTLSGDKPVIDFETKVRKKTQYVDFEEGAPTQVEGAFSFAEMLSDFETKVTEKIDIISQEKASVETDYTALKSEYDEIKPKYDNFERQELERIENETTAKKNEIFAKFDEHLSDNDKYVSIKEKKTEFSLDEIQAQCSILFTEKSLNTNFTKKPKEETPMSFDIPDDSQNEDVVLTKYGAIPKRK